MNNAMQLKAIIKNMANDKHISAQLVMQNFMLERLLERISVLAYNLETVLAEKLETVVSRGDQNTRPRDYYDVYILEKLQYKNVEINALKDALLATSQKCGSEEILRNYRDIIDVVRASGVMLKQWTTYQKDFEGLSTKVCKFSPLPFLAA